MKTENCILEFNNVFKNVKNNEIIKNISIKIPKNQFIVVMGPSGAGKSTFLNLASGLEKPTTGEIIVNQTLISNLKEPKLTKFRSNNIGYIFQQYNLLPYLNVKENIVLVQKLTGQKINKSRLDELINLIGLKSYEKTIISKLSGGQQQRVAIARALIGNNNIIFGDEPTGALDINNRNNVIKLLKDSCLKYNKSLIVVTHDPVVASFADLVLIMVDGQIAQTITNPKLEEITTQLTEVEKNV